MRGFRIFPFFGLSFLFSVFFAVLVFEASTYDSKVYYHHFSSIVENGFFQFALEQVHSSGKLEPGLYLIYAAMPDLSFKVFLLLNGFLIFLVSFLYYRLSWRFSGTPSKSFWSLFVLLFIVWYPMYMNYMWIWRSYFSISFFLCGLLAFFNRRWILLGLFFSVSLLFHFSFLFYFLIALCAYLLVLVFKLSFFARDVVVLIASLVATVLAVFLYFVLEEFGFMVSGGSLWQANDNYTGFLVSAYFMLMLVPFFFVAKSSYSPKEQFYYFCLIVFILNFFLTLLFFNNHLVVNRFSLFSLFLFVPFFLSFYSRLSSFAKIYVSSFISLGVLFFAFSSSRYLLST